MFSEENESELSCTFNHNHPIASRVSGEVVNGRNTLKHIDKAISIFGGSKAKEDSWEYQQSYMLAHELGKRNISVISGGGPGVMEAANRGTKEARNKRAKAIGLNINIAAEVNDRRHQDISIDFQHFASRKIIFTAHSDAFVVSPGGFGTLDELFEVVTLMQTDKTPIVPVILLGREFWEGMVAWIKEQMVGKKLLSEKHFNYIEIADSWEDCIKILEQKNII